jgi:hypothetical protein
MAVAPIVAVQEAQAAHGSGTDIVGTTANTQLSGESRHTAWGTLQDKCHNKPAESSDGWPDLRGLNLRDAMASLRAMDVKWEITGSGLVADQYPKPESQIGESQICRLMLQ